MLACLSSSRVPVGRYALLGLGALLWSGSLRAQSGTYRELHPGQPHPEAGPFGLVHEALPELPSAVTGFVPSDLDGDGHLDLLVGTGSNSVHELFGDGSGSFVDRVVAVPLSAPAGSIIAGDVDGDLDPDVYLGANTLLLNDGAGGLADASASLPPSSVGFPRNFFRDVDLDGDLDIVRWGYQTAHSQMRNDGLGSFTDWSLAMPFATFAPADIDMADVDSDGDDDALAGCNFHQPARLFLNRFGTYADETAFLTPAPAPGNTPSVALSDLDGDGDLDALLHRQWGFGRLTEVQSNDGTGQFVTVPAFGVGVTQSDRLEVVDFDGDGDPDLMSDLVFRNNGNWSFSVVSVAVFGNPNSGPDYPVTLADVDGDGDLDVLPIRWNSFNEIYLNDGSGRWTGASSQPFEGLWGSNVRLTLGDLDLDQDLDLLARSEYFGTRLYENDGSGGFRDVTGTHLPPSSGRNSEVALGDLDEDGAPDAVLTGDGCCLGQPKAYKVFLNQGDGTFQAPPVSLIGITESVALGDVDGDGHLDAFFGGAFNQADLLLLGDGSGAFADASSNLPAGPARTTAVALGDLDGDGDLDAVAGNNNAPNVLYSNDGEGLFTLAPSNLPPIVENPQDLLLADLETDGDLDLVVANGAGTSSPFTPFPDRLYRNEGGGVFSDASGNLPDSQGLSWQVEAGDVDGDGRLDLLSFATLWLGYGSGFVDASRELARFSIGTTTALGDVDGDGDLDVVGNPLLRNLRRQVAWHATPRAGEALTLDTHGKPGAFWWIYGSLGPGRSTLAPYGTLLLDPHEATFLASGTLNNQGTDSITLSPAQIPGLAGQTLYVQSVIGAPLLFSNLEIVSFTSP